MSVACTDPDRLHVLPLPQRPIDPLTEPFVGNACVDDNLKESVQVAIWNAIGEAERQLELTVADAVITLDGTFVAQSHREAAERAARSVVGIKGVVDRTTLTTSPMPAPPEALPPRPYASAADHQAEARPLVHVVRYCGLDDASTTAAIRQAIEILDDFIAAQDCPAASELLIVYRNRLPGAVTLEIGYPVTGAVARNVTGEIAATKTPSGPMASTVTQPGFRGVLDAADRLAVTRSAEAKYFWQIFAADDFRPWRGYPLGHLKTPLKKDRSRDLKTSKTAGPLASTKPKAHGRNK